MKMLGIFVLTAIFILITLALLIGVIRTWQVQTSLNHQIFISGKLASIPDGFYKGKVLGYKGDWQGKKFNKEAKTGINIFEKNGKASELYKFNVYQAKGLLDDVQVLRIDYNLSENPLWVRFVQDEIVETGKNKFLGKINISLLPGITFAIGYFELEK